MREFISAIGDDTYRAKGWPKQTYGVSKAAEIAATRVCARENAGRVFVAACCPGWCKSDMAGWDQAPNTAADGADTPTWLASAPLAELEGMHGAFVGERQKLSW